MKKVKIIILFTIILIFFCIWFCNLVINNLTNNRVYSDILLIPYNKVGLLLGTSKKLKSGKENMYFYNRIDATLKLFLAHKIDYIVISGDNSKINYNEPFDMSSELIKRGIPENKIFLDYAGFRTFDSVIRMKKIFGQNKFTVISQEFHNRRAIFLAISNDLYAFGYNANDVTKYNGFKTKIREKLARVKVFIDIIFNKQPKFLGDTIFIK